jgi:hypothetical protein
LFQRPLVWRGDFADIKGWQINRFPFVLSVVPALRSRLLD